MRFFICEHCKNIITFVEDSGVPVMCCGQKMTELVANTTDAAQEKHVPVVEKDGDKLIVSVGSVEHPMTEEHHIAWIAVETKNGSQIKYLDHTGAPKVEFALGGEDVEALFLLQSALRASCAKCSAPSKNNCPDPAGSGLYSYQQKGYQHDQ